LRRTRATTKEISPVSTNNPFPGGFPAEHAPERDPAPQRRSRATLVRVGLAVLVVVALGLGYLAGQLGSGDSPTAVAAAGSPAPTTTAATDTTPPAPPATSTAPLKPAAVVPSPPVKIEIPAISVTDDLVDLRLNPDGTLEVPKDYQQVGWYADGAVPGATNLPPTIFAGHVDSAGGPAVFYNLRKMAMGDQVRVTQADGKVAVFTVYAAAKFPKSQFPADTIYANRPSSELVLITCTGAFDQSRRSYDDNLVVSARLDPSLSGIAG